MFKVILRATEMAHNFLREVVKPIDVVVDATLGNGHDTLFLSSLVPEGKVYSFDIQQRAVQKFKDVIYERGLNNVILINDGHENIDNYLKESPKAIMFNLGYLPGGDKSITTLPETTIIALQKCLKLLSSGGIITMEVYPGHEGGKEEAEAVLEVVRGLDSKEFSVMEIRFSNKSNSAPFLIVIEKRCS
jgi:predicted methyltransferase